MTRYADWDSRLEAYLLAARGAKFRYGAVDCCTFALDGACAMTGEDLAAPYRGYSTLREGHRMIRERYGAKTLRGFLERVLGALPPVRKGMQQRGDLVLVTRGMRGAYALGLVDLAGYPISMDAVGYRQRLNESVVQGWKV